ncbi:MAG: hypothetical protein IJ731_05365 [Eubacterium sp.]|nr:hypothetical protein [Eubacterium sp.]
MYPINNIEGIEKQEAQFENKHVVILLFVKPSDIGADEYINKINYLHYRSKEYCSIYLVGYSQCFNSDEYKDVQKVRGVDNEEWEYSDKCFSEVCYKLKERLKHWNYSGEPEMIILQNNTSVKRGSSLDFSNYNYIDVNYGIRKQYIDSFSRFMENLIDACQKEVTSYKAIHLANRRKMKPRNVIEFALEECPKLPIPIKKVLKDSLFYKSCRDKAA